MALHGPMAISKLMHSRLTSSLTVLIVVSSDSRLILPRFFSPGIRASDENMFIYVLIIKLRLLLH